MSIFKKMYPIVDLFAGPGGLGEGFASFARSSATSALAFRTVISVEKDSHAHQTLQLRHFFRLFDDSKVPDDYYDYLDNQISLDELYSLHPSEAKHAAYTAWLCTLGEEPHENVFKRIDEVIGDYDKWVLVGGPPCQAYSLAGRSRMSGNPDFESDPRHFLYKEYLRILADHTPPVFVMENVKGLLSSQIDGDYVIKHILRDLSRPEYAIYEKQSSLEYKLYSLSEPGLKTQETDPSGFIVKAENYGIPQARHRIFIVGVRADLEIVPAILQPEETVTVDDVIGNLPKLRSGISRQPDSLADWQTIITSFRASSWHQGANGLSKVAAVINKSVEVASKAGFSRNSTVYVEPNKLKAWYTDPQLTVLTSHETRSHMTSDLHRYIFVSSFAQVYESSPTLADFPHELLPEHRNVDAGRKGKMFTDRFRVQLPNMPSTTITSHISKDGHYYIHYDPAQCRSLTVREAARLQTFPDNYKFEGTRTHQYHQVGNAVPPLLAYKIAEIICGVLDEMD